jgi:hypothetical protein
MIVSSGSENGNCLFALYIWRVHLYLDQSISHRTYRDCCVHRLLRNAYLPFPWITENQKLRET